MRLGRPPWLGLVAGSALALSVAAPAGAGDITAFVAIATPRENWSRGYGAALSSTWFKVLTFEGEAARLPGKTTDAAMTSFTASAMISPPIKLTPYGGVGYGLFRQTTASDSDIGRLRALILGVKTRIKDLVVLKAEYRKLDLSGIPLVAVDQRVSIGAGLAF
jgi:opacity protein-like surface antigen